MKSFKQYSSSIKEKWVKSIKVLSYKPYDKTTFDVFINPTLKELQSVLDDELYACRGLLDVKTGNVYVFPINFLHETAKRELKLSTKTKDTFNLRIYYRQNKKRVEVMRSVNVGIKDVYETVYGNKNLDRLLGKDQYGVITYA